MASQKRKTSQTFNEHGWGTRTSSSYDDASEQNSGERPQQRPRQDFPEASPPTTSGDDSNFQALPYPTVSSSNSNPKPISFQQPTQIASFSYDEDHVQQFDDSALRYYVQPPKGARLDYGYDQWIRNSDDRGRLDGLLRAITELRKDPSRTQTFPDSGVVSWRGVITKILTAPYEDRDGWDLNIMYANGILYLEEHLTETRLQEKNHMQPRQRIQMYYGYAFESYCTSESPSQRNPRKPGEPSGWGGDVNTNVQWCSVVRTKLGDTRIVIGGEVDCVKGKYTGRPDTFMELKTSLTIRGPHDEAKFEKKLLKFYFQSFLLGVPEIVVGFRTPSGVVATLQTFKTIEIPRIVRGKPGAWNPGVCLDWGNRFFTFVKGIVQAAARQRGEDASRNVWRATFSPGSGVNVRLLDESDVDEVVNMEDRIGFLPHWYWSEFHAAQTQPRHPASNASQEPVNPGASPSTHSGWQI